MNPIFLMTPQKLSTHKDDIELFSQNQRNSQIFDFFNEGVEPSKELAK
jgi:hypothetical protein